MKTFPPRSALVLLVGLAAVLLSGCGDDRPVADPPPDSAGNQNPAPTPVALAPAPAAQTPDPLLSGNGMGGGSPLPTSDPLLRSDPLQGRSMPTEHSHWLRGRIRDARLTVLLNGIRQGAYSGMVDQDITMRLRSGINSVTFLYTPRRTDASAQIDLLESEHDPPIPPLVTFQTASLPADATSFPQTTQSFTFFAK